MHASGQRIAGRIDRGELVVIFHSDINAPAITRWAYSVRQPIDGDRSGLREIARAEHLDLIETANRDICELAARRNREIGMVCDRTCFQNPEDREGRLRVECDNFPGVLQRELNLPPVRRKYRHAGTAGGLKARNFGERSHVENGHIILAAHSHPDFSAVAREVRLMQRAADIRRVLDGVGRIIDERHGIPTDQDNYKRRTIA